MLACESPETISPFPELEIVGEVILTKSCHLWYYNMISC